MEMALTHKAWVLLRNARDNIKIGDEASCAIACNQLQMATEFAIKQLYVELGAGNSP